MKRKLLLFALLLAGLTNVRAQQIDAGAIVSIANIKNIVPGYTGSFDVVLNNTNSLTFIAFGMDITLPEGFTYVGCEKGELLTAGHNLIRSDQGSNVSRFSSIANPNANFLGTEGVLMTVYFTVGSSSGNASAKVGLTYSGSTYNATLAQETLTVGSTVTLSENETSAPTAISGVDVTVNRTLKANVWNTLVLPFTISSSQIATVFGDGTEVASFSNAVVTRTDGKTTGIKVNFTSLAGDMEAHTPYIIKVPAALTEFTVENATITTSAEPSINKGDSEEYFKFVGTYTANTVIPDGCLFLSDNYFKYSVGSSKLKAFRGYFNFWRKLAGYNVVSAPAVRLDIDGISTDISALELDADKVAGTYYNIQGQQVAQPTKGLYIVNGKKVIIK